MCCCLLNEVDCLLGSQHRVPKIPCLFSISIPSPTQMVEDDSIFYRFHEDLPLILFQHHVHSLRKRQYTKISNTNIELLFLAGLAIACCLCRRLQRSEVLLAAQCRCYCIGCSLHFTIAQFSFTPQPAPLFYSSCTQTEIFPIPTAPGRFFPATVKGKKKNWQSVGHDEISHFCISRKRPNTVFTAHKTP